jgi:hypothetical protein
MAVTGTHTITDLLSNADAAEARVIEFGEENLVAPLQAALAAHNAQVNDMLGDIVALTTERTGTYGVEQDAEMVDADEFTRAPTVKGAARGTVGWPLRKKQFALGWTHDYFIRSTVRDMVQRQVLAQRAHVNALRFGIRDALFGPTNFTSIERFAAEAIGQSLSVKRLLNADGDAIPVNRNGLSFDGATHTHYVATASVSGAGLNTALSALVDNVVEHDHGGRLRIYINRAQETVVRALTGFTAYLPANLIAANTGIVAAQGTLDTTRLDNRAIGLFNGAEVWTKPWMPAEYYFAFDASDGRKPLRMRQPVETQLRGLRLAAQLRTHPLHADYMETYFGFGAWTRTNGAVLWANAGSGGVYAAPTF